MRKLWRLSTGLGLISVLAVVVGLAAGPATAASPGTTLTCTTTYNGVTVGNVVVPDGQTCNLNNVVVQGSVAVGLGSDFYACGGKIYRNLFASGSGDVGVGISFCSLPHVYGNVSVDSSGDVHFDGKIDGNASFANNEDLSLSNLLIGGNLACSGNGLISVYNVTVSGHRSGQCALS